MIHTETDVEKLVATAQLHVENTTNRTKEVPGYVYAYVFIWLNQLRNSGFSSILVLRHGKVQRRPFQPTQKKGMAKRLATL